MAPLDPMHSIPRVLEDDSASTGARCSACKEVIIWKEGQGWMHAKVEGGHLFADWDRPGLSYEGPRKPV